MRNVTLLIVVSLLFASCSSLPGASHGADLVTVTERLDGSIPRLISSHRVAGVGVVLIDDGAVAWTGYYGERAAGEAVDADTMFNTASLAKTVTAEVVLRLVDAGRLSLDEPIAGHWSEKDLVDDPRYPHLTPRILLSHRSGLLNWPYAYDDGKLAFVAEPGETLTYSGAGYEMLVHFVEAKLGQDFESLAHEVLYEPAGLKQISLSRQEWIDAYITHSMDRSGVYHEPYTYPNIRWVKPVGYLDGADDLYVSLENYARFLIAVMNGDGLEEELASERLRVISDATDVDGWACLLPPDRCPSPYGYGLGWTIFGYDDRTFVQHGGTDFGEHAIAYFVPESRDGVVVFVNGGNGVRLALDILDLIEPDHPLASHFRARIAR